MKTKNVIESNYKRKKEEVAKARLKELDKYTVCEKCKHKKDCKLRKMWMKMSYPFCFRGA